MGENVWLCSDLQIHKILGYAVHVVEDTYRQVIRAKLKSSAVVIHQRIFVILNTTSNTKQLFKEWHYATLPLFSDFPDLHVIVHSSHPTLDAPYSGSF